jgi:hypothetical protein
MLRHTLLGLALVLTLALAACEDSTPGPAGAVPPEQAAYAKEAKARLDKIRTDANKILPELRRSSDLQAIGEAVDKAIADAGKAVDALTTIDTRTTWDQKKAAAEAALKDLSDKVAQGKEKAKMPDGMVAPVM